MHLNVCYTMNTVQNIQFRKHANCQGHDTRVKPPHQNTLPAPPLRLDPVGPNPILISLPNTVCIVDLNDVVVVNMKHAWVMLLKCLELILTSIIIFGEPIISIVCTPFILGLGRVILSRIWKARRNRATMLTYSLMLLTSTNARDTRSKSSISSPVLIIDRYHAGGTIKTSTTYSTLIEMPVGFTEVWRVLQF